jgi:hypothetical protein
MIFQIEGIEGQTFAIRIKYFNGITACELRGGSAITIATTYSNLSRHSEQRADDYISGVIAAINHCSLTRFIPVVVYFEGED